MTYGVEVMGAPPSVLNRMRVAARACLTDHTAGKSLTLDLALRDGVVDPAFYAVRAPLVQWARAVWLQSVPSGWLHRTWNAAERSANSVGDAWSVVRGPAGAVAATLKRLGWQARSAVHWETPHGLIDLDVHSPATVALLADRSTQSMLWRSLAETEVCPELTEGVFLKPITDLVCGRSSTLSRSERNALRSVVCNGQWPQERLHRASLVSTPNCQLCGAAVGDLSHRHWNCSVTGAERDSVVTAGFQRVARSFCAAGGWQRLLWSRLLMPDPLFHYPPPLLECEPVWWRIPPDGVFTGKVYLDGSGLRGTCARRRRCGFAVVMIDEVDGGILGAMYGALPGPVQSVAAAELWALRMLLRHCMAPLDVASDCQFVVDGVTAGPAATTMPSQLHAGIWRSIWRCIDDLGRNVVTVRKVLAHSSHADVAAGRISAVDRHGNAQADTFAKLGAAMHPHDAAVHQRANRADKVLTAGGKWIGRLGTLLGTSFPRDSAPTSRAERNAGARHERKPRHRPHAICEHSRGGYYCKVCRKRRASANSFGFPCKPRDPMHHRHIIAVTGPYRWCTRCGCYGDNVLRDLNQRCRGKAQGAARGRLKRMSAGYHPRVDRWLGAARMANSGELLRPLSDACSEPPRKRPSSSAIEHAKRRCIDNATAPPTLAAARLEAVRARVTAREAAATCQSECLEGDDH